jgi:hypothetical protein
MLGFGPVSSAPVASLVSQDSFFVMTGSGDFSAVGGAIANTQISSSGLAVISLIGSGVYSSVFTSTGSVNIIFNIQAIIKTTLSFVGKTNIVFNTVALINSIKVPLSRKIMLQRRDKKTLIVKTTRHIFVNTTTQKKTNG